MLPFRCPGRFKQSSKPHEFLLTAAQSFEARQRCPRQRIQSTQVRKSNQLLQPSTSGKHASQALAYSLQLTSRAHAMLRSCIPKPLLVRAVL